MPGRNIAVAALLVIASAYVTETAFVHGIVESVNLPHIATVTHNAASTTALAAASAFSEVKNYFTNFHSGVRRTYEDHFGPLSALESVAEDSSVDVSQGKSEKRSGARSFIQKLMKTES